MHDNEVNERDRKRNIKGHRLFSDLKMETTS